MPAQQVEFGTGHIMMSKEDHDRHLRIFKRQKDDFPAEFDWREIVPGSITPAQAQWGCGACWAFAATACIESHTVIRGGPALNLSEQFPVSCDEANTGCCGGNHSVFAFFVNNGLVLESYFPYDNNRGCFNEFSFHAPCREDCTKIEGLTCVDWYTIDGSDVDQVKSALMEGPVYGVFVVHEDFTEYWDWEEANEAKWPDKIYYPQAPETETAHAIMIFGWHDESQCWLCKNSWGQTGPFSDGTLRFKYGTSDFPVHEGGCASVIVNVEVLPPQKIICRIRSDRTAFLLWSNQHQGNDLLHVFLDGVKVKEIHGASATYLHDNPLSCGEHVFSLVAEFNGEKSSETSLPFSVPCQEFVRGDVNQDEKINLADSISVLTHLFGHGVILPCEDAADANDDEEIDLADAIKILSYLFLAESLPPPHECGPDMVGEELDCINTACH